MDFPAFLNGERDAFGYIMSLGRLRFGEGVRPGRKRFNPMRLCGRGPFVDYVSVRIGGGEMRAGELTLVRNVSF